MSTYYFVVCNDCREITDAASRAHGGWSNLLDSEETLPPFIIAHHGHNIEIINEHDDSEKTESFTEWTAGNVSEMISWAKAGGNWK